MKKIQLLILSLLIFSISLSQTFVSGTIDGATWTTAGSPYIIQDDLFIASLIIEPGVSVMANGNYEIEIAGIITAIGTVQDSIVFTTIDSIPGWQGLLFNVSTFESSLKYCKIENSMNSGIRVINSTPVIEHCMLSYNSASQGGAIYFFNDTETGSEFTLYDCLFEDNTSLGHAGALYVSLIGGHIIIDNSRFNGNLSNPSQASGNFVGGALFLVEGDATILNCSFIGNRSDSRCADTFDCGVTARGGAIYIGGNSENTIMKNNIFLENQTHAENDGNCFFGGFSRSYGGAVYVNTGTVTILNNIFTYNRNTRTNCGPSTAGGAIYVNGGTVTLINSSIAYNPNATGIHCAEGTLDVMNSIIYFNNQEESQVGGSCTVTFSDIQDGYNGEGNISNNPVFIEDDSTLHITSISPCIDSGNPDAIYDDQCFPPSMGEVRNDMGAYGGPGACNWVNTPSNMTDITSFHFPEQTNLAVIDTENHTVNIEVEYGTDPTNLVATFSLSNGAIASIEGVIQQSGATANDFTNPVTYLITAEDEITVQDWIVSVTVALPNSESDILTYSFLEQFSPAIIDSENHTVTIVVEHGTSMNELIAEFSLSEGAVAEVNGDVQVSGDTPNDFTNPVSYLIIAEDGITDQEWVVTVTIAPNTETDILSYTFGIPPQTGGAIIDPAEHAIDIEVEYGTVITNLIATFSLSDGAMAWVNGQEQVPGVTPNDFTNPVIYLIVAEDGIMEQEWVVTLTIAPNTETDILTYTFGIPPQTGPTVFAIDTIFIEVEYGTNVTSLVATFTISDGAIASVEGVIQQSAITANDFTNPVTYLIIAEDGITMYEWVIIVTIAPNTETDILSYSFGIPPQTGEAEIIVELHTIDIVVEFGTNITELVAEFTLSNGALAFVDDLEQVSGETPNDFTFPVIYLIIAEDGIAEQEWLVTVDIETGINQYETGNVNIYPNPFSKNTSIEFNNPNLSKYILTVFDISGNKVFEKENIQSNKFEFKRNGLLPGTYFIELLGESEFKGKLLIK